MKNKKMIILITIIIASYILIAMSSGFYLDYQWFSINNGTGIFWTLFTTKFIVHAMFTVAFIALFFLNFLLIRLLGGKGRIFTSNILDRLRIPVFGSPRRALLIILTISVVIIGFIMGGAGSAYWKEYLMFGHAQPFASMPPDPIFNLEVGFYIFKLPFYNFLYTWLMTSLIMITLFSVFFHVTNGGILWRKNKLEFSLFARAHISSLLAIVVFLYGVGYRLKAYELLYSQIGKFFGAGYTAVNANLIAYNVAMVLSFIAAGFLLFNIVKRSFKLPIIVLVILFPAYFILGTMYPSIQQRFVVDPNELDKEGPYIKNNITFTRLAYDIEKVKEIPFANNRNLSYRDIMNNRTTLENVRLWDWRPLKQTYKQLQELKPYYYFHDVDVDRYMINRQKIAVNLSARELLHSRLTVSSQTWQNKHLIYTHGFGAVLSRVDKVTEEGLPEMLIYDIPPQSKIDFSISRPQIYYGEHNNDYVITNTSIQPGEFDYPSGEENKYTTYAGSGGLALDSLIKRVFLAAAFNDINILISGTISDKSRILFKRNIMDMVTTYTPFLNFDDDPYLVISEGRLFWIIDAYTMTDRFPYSTPIMVGGKKINYLRNSVKIVIDAYNGSMDYYITDDSDAIIKVYAGIFPGVFKKMQDLPEDLRNHVRYPETLFNIQSTMLLKYHMTEPNVFYNNEDAWDIPRQIYESNEQPVVSYYLVTKLPDETRSEFILILPFTPLQKNNMIGFLTAKCDMPDYGELKLYLLPKDKLSYGPLQIEARIDQDPEISKQLTLWNQKGSGVIRGNMLAIPVEESILYIEPLYLKAESSEMPELKRVIISFADQVVMEKDLPTALERMFYKGRFFSDLPSRENAETQLRMLAGKAHTHYIRAEQSLKAGKWKEYGEELENLKNILEHMKQVK
ncbi:MAG TPA: UPF0182 family protein [Spirochaetota bacterium]|nr:UPF0182 family protein [Spirochaetota bacterium]HPI89046.1 UPF0182 family protein [Spirochaetota bacterium]HPR48661.1 UPF0182 family protein [Spirochaetota bacterium]